MKTTRSRWFLGTIAAAAMLVAGSGLSAKHSLLYVHGLKITKADQRSCQNQQTCSTAWSAQRFTGSNVRHVGYHTTYNPTIWNSGVSGVSQLYSMLDTHCRGSNTCDLICGSMGCLTIGYTLRTYNYSGRWNVIAVESLASAENGSPVASLPITQVVGTVVAFIQGVLSSTSFATLQLGYASNRYNHNVNDGTMFYHKGGYIGKATFDRFNPGWDGLYKGRHDFLVEFFSACSYQSRKSFTKCGGEKFLTWSNTWIPYPIYTTFHPHSGHHPSNRIGSGGISGAKHGDMSSTSTYQKHSHYPDPVYSSGGSTGGY